MTGEELYLFFQQETPAGIRRAWAENPEDVAYRNALSDCAREEGWDELADLILISFINPIMSIRTGLGSEGFYVGLIYYRFKKSQYNPYRPRL